MAKMRQAAGIETRTTTQVKDGSRAFLEKVPVNPVNMCVDGRKTTACAVVFLGKVLREHPLTEIRRVPRDLIPVPPGRG
jgi:hypothetical protein